MSPLDRVGNNLFASVKATHLSQRDHNNIIIILALAQYEMLMLSTLS